MTSSDKEDTVGQEMTKNRFYASIVLTDEEKEAAIFEGQKKKFFKERSKDNPRLKIKK